MKKTCLIFCGGRSEEHEISLISAKCVLDALDRTRFTPVVVGISREGVWHLEEEHNFYTGALRADQIKLNTQAPTPSLWPCLTRDKRGKLECMGRTIEFDVVFPILHGPHGEDGTIQGLCEVLGVPYVGSDPGGSWICMDKALAKQLCVAQGIRVADFEVLNNRKELDAKAGQIGRLGFPLFVKPARLGSSVGITKVKQQKDLNAAVDTAFRFDTKVVIEKGIDGREIECAVLGLNQSARASLPGEIIPSPQAEWYTYEAKYLSDNGAQIVVPANLDNLTSTRIQEFAVRVFRALECDGMARVDLFLERKTGEIFLNEANTIPGFTPISMYPKMWQASGLSYPDLISELIDLAFRRFHKIAH